jgi:hypothetical protein
MIGDISWKGLGKGLGTVHGRISAAKTYELNGKYKQKIAKLSP